MKKTITSLLILLAIYPASWIKAQNSAGIKNIVIVHGAFADASTWKNVFDILTADGYNVSLVQNPLTSLEDGLISSASVRSGIKANSLRQVWRKVGVSTPCNWDILSC